MPTPREPGESNQELAGLLDVFEDDVDADRLQYLDLMRRITGGEIRRWRPIGKAILDESKALIPH